MRAARRLPHVHETVVHMLAAAAERSPQGEALVCDEERLTYEQYLRCVAGFSHELAGLGARGKFVAVICGNSNDMAIAMFGIHAAGAIAVPINPVYSARELAFLLADCRPMAVICDSGMAARVEPLAREQGIAHLIRIGGGEGRRLTAWRDDAGARLPIGIAVGGGHGHRNGGPDLLTGDGLLEAGHHPVEREVDRSSALVAAVEDVSVAAVDAHVADRHRRSGGHDRPVAGLQRLDLCLGDAEGFGDLHHGSGGVGGARDSNAAGRAVQHPLGCGVSRRRGSGAGAGR